MLTLVQLFIALISNWFKSPRRLEIENLYLRHQLNIAMRRAPRRFQLRGADRALMGVDDTALAEPTHFVSCCATRHDSALASRGVPRLLALEVPRSTGAPQD